jgi:hypothetical protein
VYGIARDKEPPCHLQTSTPSGNGPRMSYQVLRNAPPFRAEIEGGQAQGSTPEGLLVLTLSRGRVLDMTPSLV